MELASKQEIVTCHYKDNQLVAITHSNGHQELMSVKTMGRKETEDFYEVEQTS